MAINTPKCVRDESCASERWPLAVGPHVLHFARLALRFSQKKKKKKIKIYMMAI
eukprot:NODE_4046_length_613_cov_289.895390_g2908_i0.p5 GENE.NODE_4046_length_613_cov_289.895390_g2908_i0~~NODE_4046_length_613_cov_289.895390_g2908_i0.p5  ORF type:complete len:54 (-),score=15.02 NODE_4046_length_613_cov_289.895390_g2908_i0:25-186(-)